MLGIVGYKLDGGPCRSRYRSEGPAALQKKRSGFCETQIWFDQTDGAAAVTFDGGRLLPVPALATTEQPAVVQAATPEQAAPAATAAPEVPETEQSTARDRCGPRPGAGAPPPRRSLPCSRRRRHRRRKPAAVGDTITIDGIEYEVDRLPTETANGQLTLTDGKSYSGALVLTDGTEYAGGKYDVTELAANAFSGNTVLTSIDMTDSSVKTIGQSCFRDCMALSGVQFSAIASPYAKVGRLFRLHQPDPAEHSQSEPVSKYKQQPFAGSSIQELTVYNLSSTGIKANLLNNMPGTALR